ncbi:MAG: cystathionine beta-lyase/cystathionine gamma-synthase [Planctomycetota bacterium]|jgi:cystathionine beta-lyase/cystathionine gamma-synthase
MQFSAPAVNPQSVPQARDYASYSDATLAIHAGPGPDPTTGAILTPICQSTTFAQPKVGSDQAFTYTRTGNPTVAALELALGRLEGTPPAVCTSTGMSALSVLCLATLSAGDHVIVSDVVYGGTVRLVRDLLSRFGVRATFVDTARLDHLEEALREPTQLVILESPANPTLKLVDIRAAAILARAAGARIAVDNTFLTAVLQRPLDLGADISVYSTTKFIEGHNSTVGGALLSKDAELIDAFRGLQGGLGVSQSPQEAWLTLRGLKTLPLRLQRHSASALRIAAFLESQDAVLQVHYPGLKSFPQHALARQQQSNGGGVLAFELRGGQEAAASFAESLRLIYLAENLGAVESLLTHPATMTHWRLEASERARLGIGDALLRLSVGLEDPVDLISDISQALQVGGVR